LFSGLCRMNKKIYILIIAVFGFLMMPDTAFACKKKYSDTTSCEKEVSSKNKNTDCCKTANNTKGKQHKDCGGKCGHSNCNIPAVQIVFFVPFVSELNNKLTFFYTKNVNYFNLESSISSGFQSIWLIPKIG
jgi:hypothetical protein